MDTISRLFKSVTSRRSGSAPPRSTTAPSTTCAPTRVGAPPINLDAALSCFAECDSVTKLEALVASLPDILTGTIRKDDVEALNDAVRAVKRRLHPSATDPAICAVTDALGSCGDDERKVLAGRYVELMSGVMSSAEGIAYDRAVSALDNAWAPFLASMHGAGRSNRARRAKPASTAFSAHAGLARVDGAEVDEDGNAVGTLGDLGVTGGYDGLRVVILHQYAFDINPPMEALREKGFEVDYFDTRAMKGLSEDRLCALLDGASQCWVISDSMPVLSDAQLDIIIDSWKGGVGLYVFGDNDPYFVDANRLLSRLSEAMGFPAGMIHLTGNTPGQKKVPRMSAGGGGLGGFSDHLVSTGLVMLYEGATVASCEGAKQAEFEEVLRDHDGSLVVVAREAVGSAGPVIVDGAFTKLYCEWTLAGGSARFVRNCACWLSTAVGGSAEFTAGDAVAAAAESEPPAAISLAGAYSGTCAISYVDGPVALLATAMGDADANTSDFAIDNTLALGRDNARIICRQPLETSLAKSLLQRGSDPFTRRDVVAVIPLLDLSHAANMQAVGEVANTLFMGGRKMTRVSLMLLLGAAEYMLAADPEDPAALRYLIENLLTNCVSTPDMMQGVPCGPTVPLVVAMGTNVAKTGDFVPLRRVFGHVAAVTRLLATTDAGRAVAVPLSRLRLVARRSLLKAVVGAAIAVAKKDGGIGAELLAELYRLLFGKLYHGIPLSGSARTIEGVSAIRPLLSASGINCEALEADAQRTAVALGLEELLSVSELSAVLVVLFGRSHCDKVRWHVTTETLLTTLINDDATFESIWMSPEVSAVEVEPAVMAETMLTGKFAREPDPHAAGARLCGFVSPLGASVYRCSACGLAFGDPSVPIDTTTAEMLKQRRNAHFAEVFAADTNGYPTDTSVHYSLHRAVQIVMLSAAHRTDTTRTADAEAAVVAVLLAKSKGNFYKPRTPTDVAFAIDTYLACRAKGMAEPREAKIDFAEKAEVERQLILQARADAAAGGASADAVAAVWVDDSPPRTDSGARRA